MLAFLHGKRHLRHHLGASSWFAMELEAAPEQGNSLPHAGETDPLSRPFPVRYFVGAKATAPVPDLEANGPIQALERELNPGRGGMFANVGESFLRDPIERRFNGGRQSLASQRLLVVDPTILASDPLDLLADGGCQAEVVEHRGPEVGYNVAGIPDGLLN